MAYDEDGRITDQSNANGSSTNSSYDNYGNLSKEVLSNGPTYNYNYDLERKLTGASMTGGSSYVYGYDAVGNLISLLEKDASGNTVTTINSPSSSSMYSNKDQILGYNFIYKGYTGNPVAFNYSYNPAGLIKSTTGAGQVFTFNYDESNNPLNRINPNNITDKFTYNDANQNTGIQTVDNNGNTLISNNYTYDKDGRITNITGSLNGSSTSADYTYNNGTEKLNRLTNAVINDGTKQYTFNYSYDTTGNISTMDTANGTNTPDHSTFTYDADNRITNSGFEYDKDGNLTKAVIKGVQYQYEYDAEDRLITVKDSSGNKIASYTYDVEGDRSTKTTYNNNNPVNTTTYHYYNGELLYETLDTDPANVIHALYIRTPAGAIEAISLNYVIDSSSNTFYYYHYNAHGDVIAVTKTDSSDPTNITGKIYRQYTYDPYGNIISAKDGDGNAIDINNDSGFDDSYLYAGYRYDKESGLYFLKARYYAPGLGRFLTKDSVVDLNNTKSLNAYVYTQDDPVSMTDPDGNFPSYVYMSDDGGNCIPWKKLQVEQSKQMLPLKGAPEGWYYRKETKCENTGETNHIQLVDPKGKKYGQNEKGSYHPKGNKKDPPRNIKELLKQKLGWDWDGNKEKNKDGNESDKMTLLNGAGAAGIGIGIGIAIWAARGGARDFCMDR